MLLDLLMTIVTHPYGGGRICCRRCTRRVRRGRMCQWGIVIAVSAADAAAAVVTVGGGSNGRRPGQEVCRTGIAKYLSAQSAMVPPSKHGERRFACVALLAIPIRHPVLPIFRRFRCYDHRTSAGRQQGGLRERKMRTTICRVRRGCG